MNKSMIIIEGNEKCSITLQRVITHQILKEFAKNMEATHHSNPIGTFRNTIFEMNQTMRSPFGKIENIVKNASKNTHQCDVYAIKELQSMVTILEKEDYFNRSIRLNEQLESEWSNAKDSVDLFITSLKSYGSRNDTGVTSGDISRCRSDKGDAYIKDTLKLSIDSIKSCWQTVWHQFQDVREIGSKLGKINIIMHKYGD